jgi:hypothetical protein
MFFVKLYIPRIVAIPIYKMVIHRIPYTHRRVRGCGVVTKFPNAIHAQSQTMGRQSHMGGLLFGRVLHPSKMATQTATYR